MLSCRRIEHREVSFLGPETDVHFSTRPNREAARIHLGWMHAAKVFHRPGLRIKANELRVWIRAGVQLAVFAGVKLPEVLLGRRRFTDDFKTLLRLLWIETQD